MQNFNLTSKSQFNHLLITRTRFHNTNPKAISPRICWSSKCPSSSIVSTHFRQRGDNNRTISFSWTSVSQQYCTSCTTSVNWEASHHSMQYSKCPIAICMNKLQCDRMNEWEQEIISHYDCMTRNGFDNCNIMPRRY
jgi:hypothetical protein